jgi:hypothetical protein
MRTTYFVWGALVASSVLLSRPFPTFTAPLVYRYPDRLKAECEGIALEHSRILLKRLWQDEKMPSPAENMKISS